MCFLVGLDANGRSLSIPGCCTVLKMKRLKAEAHGIYRFHVLTSVDFMKHNGQRPYAVDCAYDAAIISESRFIVADEI